MPRGLGAWGFRGLARLGGVVAEERELRPFTRPFAPGGVTSPLLSSVPLLKIIKLSYLKRIQYTSGGRLFGLLRSCSMNEGPRNRAGPLFRKE